MSFGRTKYLLAERSEDVLFIRTQSKRAVASESPDFMGVFAVVHSPIFTAKIAKALKLSSHSLRALRFKFVVCTVESWSTKQPCELISQGCFSINEKINSSRSEYLQSSRLDRIFKILNPSGE